MVYKIAGPMGEGILYYTGAEAENSAVNFSKSSVPQLYKNQSPRESSNLKSAGKSAGEKSIAKGTAGSSAVFLLLQRKQFPSTAPSSPPGSAFLRGTLSPRRFSGFKLSQSCSRRPDSKCRDGSGCFKNFLEMGWI